MNLNPSLIADSFVSLAGFFALLTFIIHAPKGERASPLGRRILFGMGVLAALMIGRVLLWWTGAGVFSLITLTAAASVPLCALLLTEGLMRRHAPRRLKLFVATGTGVFGLLAWFPAVWLDPARLIALFAFQFLALIAIGIIVMMRDRTALSSNENRTVDRLAISLLVILPLLASDFDIAGYRLPVRLGGIGILVLCWLGLSLNRPTLRHRDAVRTGVLATAIALSGTAALHLILSLSPEALIQTFAVLLSGLLLSVVHGETIESDTEGRRDSILRFLATADYASFQAFLNGLMTHPRFEGSLLLSETDLADFDLPMLAAIFAAGPVRRRAARAADLTDPQREQLAWLFDKFEATHILLARGTPLTLYALAMPELTQSAGGLTELMVVQRICAVLAAQEGSDDRDR